MSQEALPPQHCILRLDAAEGEYGTKGKRFDEAFRERKINMSNSVRGYTVLQTSPFF